MSIINKKYVDKKIDICACGESFNPIPIEKQTPNQTCYDDKCPKCEREIFKDIHELSNLIKCLTTEAN